MRWVLLFSGQGSQTLDHLKSMHEQCVDVLGDKAYEAVNLDVVLNSGEPEASLLFKNDWAQPFIFAYQMMCWTRIRPFLPAPVYVGGYSLGEMSACAAAGLFSVEDGIALCKERARLMNLHTEFACQMLAVTDLPIVRKEELLKRFNLQEAIRPSRQQKIVVGAQGDIIRAQSWVLEVGAKQSQLINVYTPSHTYWLHQAGLDFTKQLSVFDKQTLSLPVMSAIDGQVNYYAKGVIDALGAQIYTALDWQLCQELLLEQQLDCILEIGPGYSLSKFWMSQKSAVAMRSMDEFRSMEGVVTWMHQQRS